MKVAVNLLSESLIVLSNEPKTVKIKNVVRNLDNKWRKRNEIVYATTGRREDYHRYPINPDKFPAGLWNITGVFYIEKEHYRTDAAYEEALRTYGPVVIKTDAFRDTKVWSVKNGFYQKETKEIIRDRQFWIHNSEYKTSHGCIIVPSRVIQCNLAEEIKAEIEKNGPVPLEVI